jgi:endoglucanase
MGAGWNLGCSFEAYNTNNEPVSETKWGRPRTTRKMINAIHEKGFNVLRIPITWMNHMGSAPDYTVDKKWLKRVEKVVNYGLDNGMYVIINTHHEEYWRFPDYAHLESATDQHNKLWKQIAEHFKGYGDHLIFEGMNEPRLKDTEHEHGSGTEEARDCVNQLNMSFINTVRSTGGNNAKRLLLITSYGAIYSSKAMAAVEIPQDENIAVSIHAYTPYYFTFNPDNPESYSSWDGSHIDSIQNLFNDINEIFLGKDIPVIITEYGAVDKDGNHEDVSRWTADYLTLANEYGVPCVWWDNGSFKNDEAFGIFDRRKLEWVRQDVTDTIIQIAGKNE